MSPEHKEAIISGYRALSMQLAAIQAEGIATREATIRILEQIEKTKSPVLESDKVRDDALARLELKVEEHVRALARAL